MINHFGNYSLLIALICSIFLIFQSSRIKNQSSEKLDSKIFSLLSVQVLMIIIIVKEEND